MLLKDLSEGDTLVVTNSLSAIIHKFSSKKPQECPNSIQTLKKKFQNPLIYLIYSPHHLPPAANSYHIFCQ
jgi:hypothetical protein